MHFCSGRHSQVRRPHRGSAIGLGTLGVRANHMRKMGMNGQWVGRFSGSSAGRLNVNVDELEGCYQGSAGLVEDDRGFPNALIFFRTPNKEREQRFRTTSISFV